MGSAVPPTFPASLRDGQSNDTASLLPNGICHGSIVDTVDDDNSIQHRSPRVAMNRRAPTNNTGNLQIAPDLLHRKWCMNTDAADESVELPKDVRHRRLP